MKPVGEPDVGDRHVRFDERGLETELLAAASTVAADAPCPSSATLAALDPDNSPRHIDQKWIECGRHHMPQNEEP
jgi:hypothetical protein